MWLLSLFYWGKQQKNMPCANSKIAKLFFNYGQGEQVITSYNPPINYSTDTGVGNYIYSGYFNPYPLGDYIYEFLAYSPDPNEYLRWRVNGGYDECIPSQQILSTIDTSPPITPYWNRADFPNRSSTYARLTIIGSSGCKFTVSDSTGIIYEETKENCPEVRIECGEDCPENTHCECIHNGYKCCFDENGYRIKVIPI